MHRWWRPLLGTAFLLAAWIVVMFAGLMAVLAAATIAGRPENADGLPSFGPLPDLAQDFLAIAVALPIVLLAARWVERRPAGTVSSVTGRLRWQWLLSCLPIAGVTVGVLLAGSLFLPGDNSETGEQLAGWGPFAVSMAVLLLVVPVQAAAEEYLCRGWLLQTFGAWLRNPWIPIVVQALMFAALHGWGTPWGFADLTVFGIVAGWLTVRTGGLEAAIALHVANNLLSTVIAAAYGELTITETAADLPWQVVALDVPLLAGYGMVIAWLARRRNLTTRSAAPAMLPQRAA
ncbi:CPBP family intramembrane glutamic endopeptidase [Actinoplanes sp. TFC3]|uniref:CPBP family intramembrane glutamic endopeptidase n=1 Tax=Actinoplanes sp. TFC3 TaxID=1710355 RepID=UPI001F339273|nr:CPBP family intramembrane glutamic endopeptidase [Actinoplanes sp. TFC3]